MHKLSNSLLHNVYMKMFLFQIIGWRSDALRLLLIFTDQGYHVAGDGKVRLTEYIYVCVCVCVCIIVA